MRLINILKKVARISAAAVALPVVAATSYTPSLDETLNDFDPTTKLGRYIQNISSNTVNEVVVLTNGVLTVNGESINVAEPTHTVVVTNGIVVTTNVYDAVYQDGLDEQLKEYAKLLKVSSVVTNSVDGTITTNWTEVAYLDDIPSDTNKADKVRRVCDYYIANYDCLLTPSLDLKAPYNSWAGKIDYAHDGMMQDIFLWFSDNVWSVEIPGVVSNRVDGTEFAESITWSGDFANTATRTNDTIYAFVVYTDQLDREFKHRLGEYVSKTNLYGVAKRIDENKLHTMGGIQDILRGIRDEINSMADGSGIHLTFNNVGGATLVLGPADMRIEGDSVLIDWGDGNKVTTNLMGSVSHTYDSGIGSVEVVITGFIREISGSSTRAAGDPFPFASFTDNNNNRLSIVRIDPIVGLESFGYAAFCGCGGLNNDLSFIPQTVTNVSEWCFARSAITSLTGLPDGITEITANCFRECPYLANLSGVPPGVKKIGDSAFEGCAKITSLVGIPQGVNALGTAAFRGCSSLSDLTGLAQTGITTIPEYAFMGCAISQIGSALENVKTIETDAFNNNRIEQLSRLPNLVNCGPAFAGNPLIRADLNDSKILIFGNTGAGATLKDIYLPATIAQAESNALVNAGQSEECGVWFQIDISEIRELSYSSQKTFPFGAGSKVTFNGLDGSIVYNESSGLWEDNSYRSTFELSDIPKDATVSLALRTPEQTTRAIRRDADASPTYLIDWGDGTERNTELSHKYSLPAATNVTISIIGKIDEISGAVGKPFVTVGNSPTNSNLTKVTIGNDVNLKRLGDYAFRNCTSLESNDGGSDIIGLSDSLESLGEECFAGCTSLSGMEFLNGTSLTEYPKGCFKESGISCFTTGSPNVASIGDECFEGCFNFGTRSNAYPTNLKTIGERAFANCPYVGNDTIERLSQTRVTEIPKGCFFGCTNITTLANGLENITSICDEAFSRCLNVEEISLPKVEEIGRNAFYDVGATAEQKHTEDNLPYRVSVDMKGKNFEKAAEMLGLEETDDTISGLIKQDTIVECADNAVLAYNNKPSFERWEVVTDALDISLENVPSNTTFVVQNQGVHSISGASLIWNWGDGYTSGWVDGIPSPHTYSNDGSSNYIVKVKGLLSSINGGANSGAFLRPTNSTDSTVNKYITGFNIPDGSSIRAVGNYAFAKCPNLKAVNRIDAPRGKMPQSLKKKSEVSTRDSSRSLASLYDEIANYSGSLEFGDYCFTQSGISDLSSFPSDATKLSAGVFAECTNLTSIAGLPSGIVDIGDFAFDKDSSLLSLDGFPSLLRYIPNYCFRDCTSIGSLRGLSSTSVSEIYDYSFYGCSGVKSLVGLPPTLETIGQGAFALTAITTTDGLPSGISTIAPNAFFGCTNLTAITDFPTEVDSVGDSIFMGCSSMKTIGVLPENVKSIDKRAFALCNSLKEGVIPASITNIADQAILNVGQSAEVTVDEYGISASARFDASGFDCATMLSLVSAGDNLNPLVAFVCSDGYVICVGDGTNKYWTALYKTIEFELEDVKARTTFTFGPMVVPAGGGVTVDWGDGTTEDWSSSVSHQYAVSGKYTVTLNGRIDKISGSGNGSPFLRRSNGGNPNLVSIKIGQIVNVGELGDYCFSGCAALRSIEGLSDSLVMRFGTNCFNGCTALTSLNGMPQSVTELGSGCFGGCTSLTSLEGLNDTVEELPESCFADCTGITTISNLPITVSRIGDYCFRGCSGLKDLVGLDLGQALAIGGYAFADCTSLTNLYGYGTNRTELATGLFKGCTGLVSLEGISQEIDMIPEECFMGCVGITNLSTVPLAVTDIGNSAFRKCYLLESLEGITTNLLYIRDYAFAESGLKNLSGIPNSLSYVGAYAFSGNKSLTDVSALAAVTNEIAIADGLFSECQYVGTTNSTAVLPSLTTSIGARAFENCELFEPVDVPPTCRSIGDRAFAGTYLSSITILTNSLESITGDVFADEKNNYEYYSEVGTYVTRNVFFPQVPVSYIIEEMPEFPWGASDYTKFIGNDGFIVKKDGNWIVVRKSAEIDVTTTGRNMTVAMEGVVCADEYGICVDWGDGNNSNWVTNGVSATNLYEKDGNYTITIYREIESLGDAENGSMAFLRRTLGSGSLAVRDIRLTDYSECKAIGKHACESMLYLESMPALPYGLTNLCENSFSSCRLIQAVTNLPSSVSSIGPESFRQCTYITTVYLDLPYLESIQDGLFYGCKALSNVTVNCPMLTSVGVSAFYGCSNIPYLDLSQMPVENIGSSAFSGCSNMRTLVLPSSVTNIGAEAFAKLGNDLTSIRDDDGRDYKALVEVRNTTCSMWLNIPGIEYDKSLGMFSAPTTTKFRCIDGDVVWDGSRWTAKYAPFNITITVPSNTKFHVNGITAVQGNTLVWNWGDGTVVSNVMSASDIDNHTYTNAGTYVISVAGKVASIFGTSNKKPFLAVESDPGGNPYATAVAISETTNTFKIGQFAFASFSGITNINGIVAPYSDIDYYAFSGCTGLTSIIIQPFCESISIRAFQNCTGITNVLFKRTQATTISDNAFNGCTSLGRMEFESTAWPMTYPSTFAGIGALNIYCEDIDGDAICSSLNNSARNNSLDHGSKVYTFDGDIEYDVSLSKWVLRDNIIRVVLKPDTERVYIVPPIMADANKPKLVVDWGDGSPRHTYYVNSERLANENIAGSIGHMYNNIDTYKTIKIIGKIRTLRGIEGSHMIGGLPGYYYNAFLYGTLRPVPQVDLKIEPTQTAALTQLTEVTIGDGVGLTEIGEGCFAWLSGLRADKLTIPATVTSIGKGAFVQSGIDDLKCLPRGITVLPDWCFAACKNLTSLSNMPPNVVSLGESCFGVGYTMWKLDTTRLTGLSGMPNTVTSIGANCFKGISTITSLDGLSSGVRTLGVSAFENCGLTSLEGLPSGITEIPDYCFRGNRLTTFSGMPDTVSAVGTESLTPFYGTSLAGMSSNITSIGNYPCERNNSGNITDLPAIKDTPNLVSIDGLPPVLKHIPYNAFMNFKAKAVMVPRTVETIAINAFTNEVRYVLEGKSDSDIYQTVDIDGSLNCGMPSRNKTLVAAPWDASSFWCYWRLSFWKENAAKQYVFVNGAAFGYGVSYQPTGRLIPTIEKYLPYIKAGLLIDESNVTVNRGPITLYDNETPVITDWGDGTVEYSIGTTETASHTYSDKGYYEITITTMATGIAGYGSGPFLSVGSTGQNPYIVNYHFSDSVGINTIGSTCFKNCPALVLVKCDSTVEPAVYKNDDGTARNWSPSPVGLLLNSSYTTEMLHKLAGFPWGFSGDSQNQILGIDGIQQDGTDVRFTMMNVPKGTKVTVHSYSPAENKNTKIYWGDGAANSHGYSHREDVGKDKGHSHTYSKEGTYVISISGKASGPGLRGLNGRPCIYVESSNASLNGKNPYLTRVEISDNLEINNIGEQAFINCSALSSFVCNNRHVKSIDKEAFLGTSLAVFGDIPSSVTNIGSRAFATSVQIGRHIKFLAPIDTMTISADAFGPLYPSKQSVWDIWFNGTAEQIKNKTVFPFATESANGFGADLGLQKWILYRSANPQRVLVPTVNSSSLVPYKWPWSIESTTDW